MPGYRKGPTRGGTSHPMEDWSCAGGRRLDGAGQSSLTANSDLPGKLPAWSIRLASAAGAT